MFGRLRDTLLAARHRANFPGKAYLAKDHQVLRQWPVTQAGHHRQQQCEVSAGLGDFHAAHHVNKDVLIRHLQAAVTVQHGQQDS